MLNGLELMPFPLDDTIVAVASARGGAVRGIVRVSGPGSVECLRHVLPSDQTPKERSIETHPSVFPAALLIRSLPSLPADVFCWPVGRSYTGQATVEIHTLGCPPLLEQLVEELCAAGARLAEPGEFTLRAFLSGRIDLTQAEGVLGAIEAVGDRQVKAALVQLAGGLARPLGELRDRLVDLLAHLEAGFDFADEDISFLDSDDLLRQLQEARRTIETLAERMSSRREANEVARVVLTGPPNAGKSSLFNALATDVGALVSDMPGTTRDYLYADLKLDGQECRLLDTAGIGPHDSDCEAIDGAAQEIARQQAEEADIVLHCFAASDAGLAESLVATSGGRPLSILVRTKADLAAGEESLPRVVVTSARTGQGIPELERRLGEAIAEVRMGDGDVVVGTAVRCHQSLRAAAHSLQRATQLAEDGEGDELVAAEMRLALEGLGRVVGAVYTDDLLDRIFSRFCVGK